MRRFRALPDSMARAHLSLIAVVVIWAGSFSVIKATLDDGVAAIDIAILRYAVAVPGFAFILWRARGLPGLTRGDAVRVAGAGMLVVVGYHLFLNFGTQHTTSGVAALVVALAPGITVLLALALGLERIRPRHVVGLAVAFSGVVVVVALGSGQELSFESVRGPLLVLGAPISFALYNVILKPLLGRYDLLALTAASSLVGTIGLVPLVRSSTVDVVVEDSTQIAALILYLGVLATLLGYILWNAGLRSLGPTRAVTYAYGIPPLAVIFGRDPARRDDHRLARPRRRARRRRDRPRAARAQLPRLSPRGSGSVAGAAFGERHWLGDPARSCRRVGEVGEEASPAAPALRLTDA